MKSFINKVCCWELWPFSVIYAPLGFVWLYYIIRARAVWFFSNVNPTLEFAGFEGENKREMYEQLPRKYYPKTLFISCGENILHIEKRLLNAGIKYPFVVKPQIGMHAMLFRKIDYPHQLYHYHNFINVDYMIQEYVDLPMEFSVFHVRYPGQTKGSITGFILKDYLKVTGDGVSTLMQLIMQHPKARYRQKEMEHKHHRNLYMVLPKGKQYFLSIAGNHNRGATFINLDDEIDEQLHNVFDKISNDAGHFYFGRYDLKCASIDDLKAGKNFYILEYNGAGAEPNHIYDCGMSYWNAMRIIKKHWQFLYEIGRINFKNGVPYWSFKEGFSYLRNAKKFFKKMRIAEMHCQLETTSVPATAELVAQ